MIDKSMLATVSVAACLLAAPAHAQNSAKWGEVGGWSIRVDRTIGDGCYAHQSYEDGTDVRVGFDMKKKSIFFMIANPAWRSLEVDRLYRMRLTFDDQQSYNGEFRGLRMGDLVWLDHSNVSAAFAGDFMQRNGLRVYYNGARIAGLSLRNTYLAVTEVMNCQREMAGAGRSGTGSQPATDPFTRRPTDPFSR